MICPRCRSSLRPHFRLFIWLYYFIAKSPKIYRSRNAFCCCFFFGSHVYAVAQVAENEREPCLVPTIPPPDEDARWVYSSGQQLGPGPAVPPQGSTPPAPLRKSLSSLSLGSSRPPSPEVAVPAHAAWSRDAVTSSPDRSGRKAEVDSDNSGGKHHARKGGRGRIHTKGPLEPVASGDVTAATTDKQQRRPFQKLWREQIRKHRYHAAARLPRGNQSSKLLPTVGTTEERGGFRVSSNLPRSPVSREKLRARRRGDFGSGGIPRSVDWDSPAALSLWGGSLSVTPWHREGASPVSSGANGSRGLAGVEMGAAGWAEQVLGIDL